MALISITSADYIKYNANTSGRNTSDCVNRSISFALDLPYVQVHRELLDAMKNRRSDSWKYSHVYSDVIYAHGGSKFVPVEPRVVLNDLIDTVIPNGTYLVETAHTKTSYSNHIVCVSDGNVFDSWDSRNEYAVGYYHISGSYPKELTDIKDHFTEFGQQIAQLCHDLLTKYATKYNWNDPNGKTQVSSVKSDGGYRLTCFINLCALPDGCTYPEMKQIKIPVVFTPSTTVEEGYKIIQETCKIRMYDRCAEFNKAVVRAAEVARERAMLSDEEKKSRSGLWLSKKEEKFLKTLPAWAQARVQYICIDEEEYARHSDNRYTVDIMKLPDDDHPSPAFWRGNRVRFFANTADALRDEIDRYRSNREIPGVDYVVDSYY